jgi:hypothetical protein
MICRGTFDAPLLAILLAAGIAAEVRAAGESAGATSLPTPPASQRATQPAPGLRQVKLVAGMKRAEAERLIAEATGVKSTYDVRAMDTAREVTYRQGSVSLIVQYQPGAPAPTIALPNGSRESYPPIDGEVISWSFATEDPKGTQPASRPAPPPTTPR